MNDNVTDATAVVEETPEGGGSFTVAAAYDGAEEVPDVPDPEGEGYPLEIDEVNEEPTEADLNVPGYAV